MGGWGGRGAGRVFAGIWGGGGLNIFFRGRSSHQALTYVRGYGPSVPSYVPSAPWTFCPLKKTEFPHKSSKTSRVSLGRPEFVPGTLPGHSDHHIPLCDFSLSVFCLHIHAFEREWNYSISGPSGYGNRSRPCPASPLTNDRGGGRKERNSIGPTKSQRIIWGYFLV